MQVLKTDEPESKDSFDFNYNNDETNKAADTLKRFYTDAESELNNYVETFKTSNEVLKLLKKYESAASSAAGTKCKVPKKDKNKFSGAQENVESLVLICAKAIPENDFNTLNNTVKEDLAKVQTIDNTLRLNGQICFSLRVPPSPNCQKTKQQALDRLGSILSTEELTKLSNLSKKASEGAKKSVEQCVKDGTKSLVANLIESISAISDCNKNQ